MNIQENETPKYRKKKNQNSKSNRRSDHKHVYERVIVQGWLFGYNWTERCKICGRINSLSYLASLEGLRKPRTTPYISSENCYTLDEIREKYPDARIFKRRVDENGRCCYGDEDLIEITSEVDK